MFVGIDFGTSKSVISMMQSGQPVIVPMAPDQFTLPSAVMVTPDEQLFIGWEALNHRARYQSEHFTISSVKRLMGKAGETSWAHLKTYPQEISALILGCLKIQAEAWAGEEITGAVIAVPAHFDINQRWSTMQAAEIAGLKVLRMVNEATAAMLTYAETLRKEATVVVFDLGAGTLDVSVVDIGEGVSEVRAMAGDDRLGGDDFDQVLVDYLLKHIASELDASTKLDPVQMLVLKEAAMRAKVELSTALTTRIYIPGFLRIAGKCRDLEVSLDRSTFERLAVRLFDRAADVLKAAIKDSDGGDDLTDLFLIGGGSSIPCLRDRVSEITKLKPSRIDQTFSVAKGAAIQAACLSGQRKNMLLLDVTGSSWSIAVKDDKVSRMIEKNTTIPTVKDESFTTTENAQPEIVIRVYQGEKPIASQNTFVGQVRLTGLPSAQKGVPQIEVKFDLDAAEILNVSAKDRLTGNHIKATMEAPYRLNQAQVKVLSRKVSQELQPRMDRLADEVAKERAKRLVGQIEALIRDPDISLEEAQIQLLASGVQVVNDQEAYLLPADFERLLTSVNWTYEDLLLGFAAQTARSIATSPFLSEWAHAVNSRSDIETAFAAFEATFKEQLRLLAIVFNRLHASSLPNVEGSIVDRLQSEPAVLISLNIVLGRFHKMRLNVDSAIPTNESERLLQGVLLHLDLSSESDFIKRSAVDRIMASNQCDTNLDLAAIDVIKSFLYGDQIKYFGAYLDKDLEVVAKINVIRLLAALRGDKSRGLLIKCLSDKRKEVQLVALKALEQRNESKDMRRLLELVKRSIEGGERFSLREKYFLRKFGKENSDAREVVAVLQA